MYQKFAFGFKFPLFSVTFFVRVFWGKVLVIFAFNFISSRPNEINYNWCKFQGVFKEFLQKTIVVLVFFIIKNWKKILSKMFNFRGKSVKSFEGKICFMTFIKKLLFYFHRFVFFNALSDYWKSSYLIIIYIK